MLVLLSLDFTLIQEPGKTSKMGTFPEWLMASFVTKLSILDMCEGLGNRLEIKVMFPLSFRLNYQKEFKISIKTL